MSELNFYGVADTTSMHVSMAAAMSELPAAEASRMHANLARLVSML